MDSWSSSPVAPMRSGDGPGSVSATIRWAESATGRRYDGYEIPMRRLPSLLVEVGVGGAWEVVDEDGSRLLAEPGRILVVPPDAAHSLTWRGSSGTTQWWMLSISDGGRRNSLGELKRPWLPSESVSENVLAHLRSAGSETGTLQDRIDVSLTALTVLAILLKECGPIARDPAVIDHRIRIVLEYIDSHLDQPLPRGRLAQVAYLSPTRFHYVFVENIGVPPSRYVLTRRIDRARELLGSGDATVKEIAAEVGFRGAEPFTRAFHARVGISPSRYRTLLRGG